MSEERRPYEKVRPFESVPWETLATIESVFEEYPEGDEHWAAVADLRIEIDRERKRRLTNGSLEDLDPKVLFDLQQALLPSDATVEPKEGHSSLCLRLLGEIEAAIRRRPDIEIRMCGGTAFCPLDNE